MSYPGRVQIYRETIPKCGTVWKAYTRRSAVKGGSDIIGFGADLTELLHIFPHADVHSTSAEVKSIVKAFPDAECVLLGVAV